MALRDQIEAARQVDDAGQLTPASRAAISGIKARALQNVIEARGDHELPLPEGRKAAISAVRQAHEGDGLPLQFRLVVADSKGKTLYEDDVFVFNPPSLTIAGQDDPETVFAEMLASIAEQVAG